jgi:hypothetical protein
MTRDEVVSWSTWLRPGPVAVTANSPQFARTPGTGENPPKALYATGAGGWRACDDQRTKTEDV